jgi:hypothetical protein
MALGTSDLDKASCQTLTSGPAETPPCSGNDSRKISWNASLRSRYKMKAAIQIQQVVSYCMLLKADPCLDDRLKSIFGCPDATDFEISGFQQPPPSSFGALF